MFGQGDQQVLQFSAPCADVVGGNAGQGDETCQRREGSLQCGWVERAIGQVDALAVCVQDAEHGRFDTARHHHLGLVAEGHLGAGHRRHPAHVGMRGQGFPAAAILGFELPRVGRGQFAA
jgi:hypothetical protein